MSRFAVGWVAVLSLGSLLSPTPSRGDNPVIITISPGGANAKYIGPGTTDELKVTVQVGQTVRWVNSDSASHTATCTLLDADRKPLFDTGRLRPGAQAEVVLDGKIFGAAGGQPGQPIELPYSCDVHGQMMSSTINLVPTSGAGPNPPPTTGTPSQPPNPNAKVQEIQAVSGTDQKWVPNAISQIKQGDEIVWRNQVGLHGLSFPNWSTDSAFFEFVSSDIPFDVTKGENPAPGAATPNQVMARLRVKSIPPSGKVHFICWIHGNAMAGDLNFGSAAIQPPKSVMPITLQTPTEPFAAFDAVKVDNKDQDSYYALAADFNGDGLPDLATSGLGEPGKRLAEIAWYENPSWQKHVVGMFDVPVALSAADVDGDGAVDLAVCYEYGFCVFGCKAENGTVAWLRNPGKQDSDTDWKVYHVGKNLASHRLAFGHFTQQDNLELLSVPVVGGVDGKIHDPINLTLFSRPKDVLNAKDWPATVVNKDLRVIHQVKTKRFAAADGSPLDSSLLAAEEGVVWLNYNPNQKWRALPLGPGETNEVFASTDHWKGSGSADAGRVGDDPFGYLVATEPFHGDKLAVYSKVVDGSLERIRWKRHELDRLGPINNRGEGPGHDVATADIDGDGTDEFLVGLRGPIPYGGVQIYKVKDLARGQFVRQQVSAFSSAIVVVADFDRDGRPDFATIPYRVASYYISDTSEVMVFLNRTPWKTRKPVPPAR